MGREEVAVENDLRRHGHAPDCGRVSLERAVVTEKDVHGRICRRGRLHSLLMHESAGQEHLIRVGILHDDFLRFF